MNFDREELEMLSKDSGGTFTSATVKMLAADLLDARGENSELRAKIRDTTKWLDEIYNHDFSNQATDLIIRGKVYGINSVLKEFADE